MSLVATPIFPLVGFPLTQFGNVSGTARNISAGTHWVGTTFVAPYTGTIDEIHFLTSTVSSPLLTLQCAVTQIDASGFPLGADVGTPQTAVTNPAATTLYSATGLGASVTAGTIYGLIVRVSSYTSGSVNIRSLMEPEWNVNNYSYDFYLGANHNIGSNAWGNGRSLIVPKYSSVGWVGSQYFYPPRTTIGSLTTGTSSGNVVGNKFTTSARVRVAGYIVIADCDAANIEMYSGSDNTAISNSSIAVTNAYRQNAASETQIVMLSTAVTLEAGTYRVGVRNTSTTANAVYRGAGMIDSTAVELLGLGGKACMLTSYASGAWTDTNTALACVSPLIEAIEDGAATGVAPVIGG